MFDQLSNAYHYTGSGKMYAGWGMYLSSDKDGALYYSLNPLVTSMVWLIDGKKVYHRDINIGYGYMETLEDQQRFIISYDKFFDYNWRDDLIYFMRALNQFEEETPYSKARYDLVLKKLESAKEVKVLSRNKAYLYTVAVQPRKIFYNEETISPQLRRAINKRLAAEKRKMVYPAQPIKKTKHNGIYGQLEAAFAHRYRYAKPKKDTTKLTSLFLHRIGYDLIKTNYLQDEYLLIDISKAKIVKREYLGV